ncbi:hypothetical protein F0562_017517 [Nyssa sinensis]|uniref:Uncharacterized protein n=1 Tax=Nyssa sinensis TaxID=561372 RepID=A0A5J4ZJ37_9ASTE|nr:hypothetical protein F0562_017517 [Nyssa sinensis]
MAASDSSTAVTSPQMAPNVPLEIKDDEWIISIMAEGGSEWGQIPKVIPQLRKHEQNKGFYDPQIVSIGPYHHGKPELQEGEKLKSRVAFEFVKDSKREAHEFYNKILEVVDNARNYYLKGSTDTYDQEAFAHMMFLDGCLVLSLLESCENKKPFFQIFDHSGFAAFSLLFVDIILLENQLPFLVLQALMSTRFPEYEGEGLINTYIDNAYMLGGRMSKKGRVREYHKHHKKQPHHLLELVRKRFLSHSLRKQASSEEGKDDFEEDEEPRLYSFKFLWSKIAKRHTEHNNLYSYLSATELKAKGIHFKPASTFYLNDFSFTSLSGYGQLTLPQVVVDSRTKYLFLNMMAYELAPHPGTLFEVSTYIYFMNSLINEAADVFELRSKNIILNFLGTDKDVANVFHTMTVDAVPNFHIIEHVSDKIQQHYNSKTKTWMAEVLHDHFSSPWAAVALFAAIFAIGATEDSPEMMYCFCSDALISLWVHNIIALHLVSAGEDDDEDERGWG